MLIAASERTRVAGLQGWRIDGSGAACDNWCGVPVARAATAAHTGDEMAITGSDMKALREMMRETVRESEDRLGARLDGVVARHSAASQQVVLDAVTRTVSPVPLEIEVLARIDASVQGR